MEKLKIKFIRYKNVVLMEVLEQPEKTKVRGVIYGCGVYKILSVEFSGIRRDALCIRRFQKEDDRIAFVRFNTEQEAIDSITAANDAIRAYNSTQTNEYCEQDSDPVVTVCE